MHASVYVSEDTEYAVSLENMSMKEVQDLELLFNVGGDQIQAYTCTCSPADW